MKSVKLLIIGYGNVGKAFSSMLKKRADYFKDTFDVEIRIVGIVTRSKGALLVPDGIDSDNIEQYEFDKDCSALDAIAEADYDIMVELTPINIMSGMPAIQHIETAIRRKKHVITANKGPIAWAYRELKELAEENGVCLRHESTVMDGVPVFDLAEDTLMACKVTEIKGILNATTNYILDEMEKGVAYEDAVAEGKRRGFVEADPSMDVDGWDASAKLTALMNVLMGVKITPIEINRTGISSITQDDIEKAKQENKKYKLLCHGYIENGKPVGVVKPTLVNADDVYASINGTAAMVTINTDLMGEISIVEHVYVPEIDQTAYGVLIDLIKILKAA